MPSTKQGTTLAEALTGFLTSRMSDDDSPSRLAEDVANFLEREFMQHTWINAFALIHPSDDLLKQVGQQVVDELMSRRQEIDTLGVRFRAAYMWWNAS